MNNDNKPNSDKSTYNVFKNVVHFAASNAYRHVLGFITTLFRPTLLGPELYGLWSLLNVPLMYAGYSHLGARTAMRYRIPQLDGSALRQVTQTVLVATVVINLLLALLVGSYALLWAESDEQQFGWLMLAVVLVLNCIYEHRISELKGHKQFILVSKATYFRYTLNFVFTALFIYLWGFYGAMIALLLGVAGSLVFLHHRTDLPAQTDDNRFDFATLKRLIISGAPIVALDLVGLALRSIDKLLVALLLGAQSLGYYAIGSMLVGPLMNIPGASREVNEQVLMGEHNHLSVRQQLDDYLLKPLRFSAYFMPLLIAGVYCALPAFVSLILPDYQAALAPAQTLMFGAFFLALSYPCRGIIVANSWQKQAAKWAILAVLLGIILITYTINQGHQLVGVAVSSGIGFFALFMILTLFIFNQFKQPLWRLWAEFFELMLPFMLMLAVLLLTERFLPDGHPILTGLMALGLFGLCYAPLLLIAYQRGRFIWPGKKKKDNK